MRAVAIHCDFSVCYCSNHVIAVHDGVDDNELTGDVPALPSSLVGGKCQLENNDLDNEDNADALECDT